MIRQTTAASRRRFLFASSAIGSSICAAAQPISAAELTETPNYDADPVSPNHTPEVLTEHVALVVVDMQRYFVRPDHAFTQTWEAIHPGCSSDYFDRMRKTVLPNCTRLIKHFRTRNAPIVFTAFGSLREDGLDLPLWARDDNRLARKTVGQPMYPSISDASAEVDDALGRKATDLILPKTTCGACASSNLDAILKRLGVRTVVVCGVATDVCVIGTARELADRDFHVIVAEDGCYCYAFERHHAALSNFAMIFGQVRSSDYIVDKSTERRK